MATMYMMAVQNKVPQLVIRFLRRGCSNRPFYHIIVAHPKEDYLQPGYEQLGSFDPIPNENNEKLLAVNVERLQYWLAQGAEVNAQSGIVLGLAGVLPIHPECLKLAWENRQKTLAAKKASEDAEVQKIN